MKKIVVVTGLPGSGKSTHIRKTFFNKAGYRVISEDYQAGAFGNSPKFEHSKYYEELRETLSTDTIPVISDLRYCSVEEQTALIESIHRIDPSIEIEWVCMMTPPEVCIKNIEKRNRHTKAHERYLVARYSPCSVPANATLMYWQDDTT